MKPLSNLHKTTANALIWAATMIASALLMQGSGNSGALLILMIAGWFVTDRLLRDTTERRCAGKARS